MNIVAALVSAVLSAGLMLAAVLMFRKRITSSVSSVKDGLMAELGQTEQKLDDLVRTADSFASKGQLESLTAQIEAARVELEGQKDSLKGIESKLDTAQKTVEEKEAHQQDLKSSKEEDEAKLQEVLEKYESISNECVTLEQQLAASLKSLDTIIEEIDLTQDQKALLGELSNSLTNAGGRLRDLLTEYGTVNERLKALQLQHTELEDEYTKLVEQQLGE